MAAMKLSTRALLSLIWASAACLPADQAPSAPEPEGKADQAGFIAVPAEIASQNDPDTVDVGSWNLAWFGHPWRGPKDDELQVARAAEVIGAIDLDIVGLVEVASEDAFTELVADLPDYRGLLVTDDSVEGGAAQYGELEQKVALLVHERFTIAKARVILADDAWAFAGRPPLEVTLRFEEDERPRTLVVVVAHFKAMANVDGYDRRVDAAAALHEFIGAEYPERWVLVIGDFNDDIDASTYLDHPSPFEPFVEDPGFRFTTDAISARDESTTVYYHSTIDHHLATRVLARRFVEGSAQVLRVDQAIPSYASTTSDHFPVLTRYDLR